MLLSKAIPVNFLVLTPIIPNYVNIFPLKEQREEDIYSVTTIANNIVQNNV